MIFTCTSGGSTRPNGLFLRSTNPRQSMMITASSMEWGLSAVFPLIHGFLGPITHSRQDLKSTPKKCTHGGHPLESPLAIQLPHVISLHQSTPHIKSLNPVARSVRAHSSLISYPVHHGEFAPINCVVLGADRCLIRHAQDPVPLANGPWMLSRPVQTLYPWGIKSLGQNVTMGSPDRPEVGPRSASPSYGGWVSWLFIILGVGPLSLYLFLIFHRGIQGVRVSTNSAVACLPVSLPSTRPTQLGRAILGSKLFLLIFFVQIHGSLWKTNPFAIFINGSPIPPLAECATIVSAWWMGFDWTTWLQASGWGPSLKMKLWPMCRVGTPTNEIGTIGHCVWPLGLIRFLGSMVLWVTRIWMPWAF